MWFCLHILHDFDFKTTKSNSKQLFSSETDKTHGLHPARGCHLEQLHVSECCQGDMHADANNHIVSEL